MLMSYHGQLKSDFAEAFVFLRRRRAARDECRVKQVKGRLRRRSTSLRGIPRCKDAHVWFNSTPIPSSAAFGAALWLKAQSR